MPRAKFTNLVQFATELSHPRPVFSSNKSGTPLAVSVRQLIVIETINLGGKNGTSTNTIRNEKQRRFKAE